MMQPARHFGMRDPGIYWGAISHSKNGSHQGKFFCENLFIPTELSKVALKKPHSALLTALQPWPGLWIHCSKTADLWFKKENIKIDEKEYLKNLLNVARNIE